MKHSLTKSKVNQNIPSQVATSHARFVLILIIVIASFLRLWKIGVVPPGITNDESGFFYSAYSLWKTGRDPTGHVLPLSINLDNSFTVVDTYLIAPFVGILGLTPTAGRLPSAMAGILSVYIMYLVTQNLFRNTPISLAASAILATSPWHVFASRIHSPTITLLFILLTLLFFQKSLQGSVRFAALSMVFSFLAFHSYHAAKIYFTFFIPFLFLLYRHYLRPIQRTLVIGAYLITFLTYMLIIESSGSISRSTLLLTNDLPAAAVVVNAEREKSTAPVIIRTIFSNKATVLLRSLEERYLEAFSVNFHFLYGETGALAGTFAAIPGQGAFYVWTIPFILAGLAKLFYTRSKSSLLLFGLMIIAPLPSALTIDKTYVFRSILFLVAIPVVMAVGANELYIFLLTLPKKISVILAVFFIFLCTWETSAFLVNYFYRLPIYLAERWFTSSKDLAFYLQENEKKYDRITVYKPEKMFLLQFGIYTHVDPITMMSVWNNNEQWKIGTIQFNNYCPESLLYDTGKQELMVLPELCWRKINAEPFTTIVDRGEPLHIIWKVYTTNTLNPTNTTNKKIY